MCVCLGHGVECVHVTVCDTHVMVGERMHTCDAVAQAHVTVQCVPVYMYQYRVQNVIVKVYMCCGRGAYVL